MRPKKLKIRSTIDGEKVQVVMPGGEDVEISYRVKCVVVETERVFGDFLVTQQTREQFYWLGGPIFSPKRRLSNLTKQTLETPDFWELNAKPMNSPIFDFSKVLQARNDEKGEKSVAGLFFNADRSKMVQLAGNGPRVKNKSMDRLPILRESRSQEAIVTTLVDQLLLDIYGYPRSERGRSEGDTTASSYKPAPPHRYIRRARLLRKSKEELAIVSETLIEHVNHVSGMLVRQLRRKDYLMAKRNKHYDVITAHLQAYSAKRSEDTRMRFSLTPQPGESGFTQWLDAMKMVARLQGGIPQEFRKRLWLTLAERHLDQRGVDWKQAEKICFNEWSNPDDEELGIQIVKDLHRTGCSLFCGAAGRDNQAVLRRVLLGYARWNKSVGYCQGLNVLAALILQVTDRAENSAVKVMIYLIEGVLPEGYFADNLRGLSVDMAVFRDLLRMRLPRLSRHLEALQCDAKDKATGSSYEPPLTNVFTMQWFLTLFCHCLPQEAVLRVWDLIFLEGDDVLLRTALAIWEGITDRIMTVTSADEFYSIMGVLTREMLEFTDVNNLIKTIVGMGPLYGITDLREKHRYNITPWSRRLSDEEDTDTEEEERLAVAAAMFGVPHRFRKDRSSNASSSALQTIGPASDKERLALDISTLKQQYAKLRERQRQAHIILSAACARQSMVPSTTSQAMNHLLVGKSALVSAKTRQLGPPPGAIPPKPKIASSLHPPKTQPPARRDKHGVTLHWKDTKKVKGEAAAIEEAEPSTVTVNVPEVMSAEAVARRDSASGSDSDSTSTELCDEPDRLSDIDSEEPTSTSDCYIMATDDENNSRPGESLNTALRPAPDKTATGKEETVSLETTSLDEPSKTGSESLLDIQETETSIAMITHQIQTLSASEDDSGPANDRQCVEVTPDDLENRETPKSPPGIVLGLVDSVVVENLADSAVTIDSGKEVVEDLDSADSVKSFRTLDRYDFSSGKAVPGGANGSVGLTDTPGLNGFSQEKVLNSGDLVIPNYTNSSETSGALVCKTDNDSAMPDDERTFYPRSYVIGHLPIAPAIVNEKLSRSAEVSPVAENIRILNNDSTNIESQKNCGADCKTILMNGSGNESRDCFLSCDREIETLKNAESDFSLPATSMEARVPNNLGLFDIGLGSNDHLHLDLAVDTTGAVGLEPEIVDSLHCDNSTVENMKNSLNSDPMGFEFDSVPAELSLSEFDKIRGEATPATTSNRHVLEDGTLKLGTSYVYQDSLSMRIFEGSKRSPRSPESGKSFSSGETMGPDSKVSSPTASFRSPTNRSDSRLFAADISERSSYSSDSKTMTLRSLESEIVTSDKMKLDAKSEVTRLSMDKSSPSTPISVDSLKNKSEISPKFVISSSSESCSPGKANKSSDRSFSSELQSPVSANSIKYRANYADGLDNLSESPMEMISSAASPFYPIVNPNQKTPSPYGGMTSTLTTTATTTTVTTSEGKHASINGVASKSSSPEQNTTSSPRTTEGYSPKYHAIGGSLLKTASDFGRRSKIKDEYDSARPFATELAETLSNITVERSKNDRIETTNSFVMKDPDPENWRIKKPAIVEDDDDPDDRWKLETDEVSPLPGDKFDSNRSAFIDKTSPYKGVGLSDRDHQRYTLSPRNTTRPFERSCSSLEKRLGDLKASPSSDDIGVKSKHKKRSSDILEDLKHLESKTLGNGAADTRMMTQKTGYVWEDLKNLEARRQDTFSDSASEFSKTRLDLPQINVLSDEPRKSYVVEPRMSLEEGSDSRLKSYARKKSNGEPDDDRESKLGVWTKVRPRAGRDNGRRSSDRALKIIQENSAILHKILTCQARKRLPDLEEISKEITISPINEEISKIFSPILEKMGLNEHEINEELARINFKDFDQMTTTSGSEFDAKMNDELSKLSLIDDNEIVDHLGLVDEDEPISRSYLDTREALIDRQINEELSKLLANYEVDSPSVCATVNRKRTTSCQNPSEVEPLDISNISNNVFSYESSNDSIELKSDLDPVQENAITENFSQFTDDSIRRKFSNSITDYSNIHVMSSTRSDIDIYQELEKLDKISSGEILPSSSTSIVAQKSVSPISYASLYPETHCPVTLDYLVSAKTDTIFDRSPIGCSSYNPYKPFADLKSRISPRKTPSNPYSVRSYEKSPMSESFDLCDPTTQSPRLYDLGTPKTIMSKETLEFRVRYEDDPSRSMVQTNDLDLDLDRYRSTFVEFDRGASYYPNDVTASSLKRQDTGRGTFEESIYNHQSEFYNRKYEAMSPEKSYSAYGKSAITDFEVTDPVKVTVDGISAYMSPRNKNPHLSISPFFNPPSGLEDPVNRPEVLHEYQNIRHAVKYPDSTAREIMDFRKASLTLGPLDGTARISSPETAPSPKSLFTPFPIRNTSRKPKELGLKLGLYSPSSHANNSLKRS